MKKPQPSATPIESMKALMARHRMLSTKPAQPPKMTMEDLKARLAQDTKAMEELKARIADSQKQLVEQEREENFSADDGPRLPSTPKKPRGGGTNSTGPRIAK